MTYSRAGNDALFAQAGKTRTWEGFLILTITLADVLPVAIVVAVQAGHCKGGCPYPDHLFIDVLAKVGHVKNPSSIFQVRIS